MVDLRSINEGQMRPLVQPSYSCCTSNLIAFKSLKLLYKCCALMSRQLPGNNLHHWQSASCGEQLPCCALTFE